MRRIVEPTLVLTLLVGLGLAAGCKDPRTGDTSAMTQEDASLAMVSPKELSVPDCCKTMATVPGASESQVPSPEVVTSKLTIPEVVLIDQSGKPVNIYEDLAKDKLLVINFVFTTCKGICPPMGVNFGQLQRRLGNRLGRDVSLASLSVDPVTDTPERMKAWGEQFGASKGWTLLTGPKKDVDRLLKGLGAFTANKSDHSPFILIGRISQGRWQRVHGMTPVDKLAEIIVAMLDPHPASSLGGLPGEVINGDVSASGPATLKYFTEVPLINQYGDTMRLYSDVLKDKVVVFSTFFTSCRTSCPHLIDTFAKLQTYYGDRVGKDLYLISLTVDPDTDTPEKLKTYAEQVHALPGWYFLSGDKKNIDTALGKLGQRVKVKEDHSNIFIIGKERTGLWKKAMGLAPPEEIIKIIDSVLKD